MSTRCQRNLVRALLRRPRVLVVDEPTADLDADSADLLHTLLGSYPGTLLVVSHRPATLADMDRTVTLARVPTSPDPATPRA